MGLLLYNAAKQRENDFAYSVFMVIMLAMVAGFGSPTFMILRLSEVMAFAIAAGLFLVREGKLGDKE